MIAMIHLGESGMEEADVITVSTKTIVENNEQMGMEEAKEVMARGCLRPSFPLKMWSSFDRRAVIRSSCTARRSNEQTVIASVQLDIELVSTNNDDRIADDSLPPIKHYKRGRKQRQRCKARGYGSKTTRTQGALFQS